MTAQFKGLKLSKMKRSKIFKNYITSFALISVVFAQLLFAIEPKEEVGITFIFANGEVTTQGDSSYYEFDVMCEADESDTFFGSGMVYINYNTDGFGEYISTNNKIIVTKGALLQGELTPGLPLYTIVNIVDNTLFRVAITTDYNYPANPLLANPLTTSPIQYLHIRILIYDPSQNAGLSFEQSLMEGQQYHSNNSTTYSPLIAIDTDNSSLPISNVDIAISKYGLLQNTPNPFGRTKTSTEINFVIDKTGLAEVKIYNVRGQLVRNLFIGIVNKDEQMNLIWNGKDEEGNILTSGIYFYQLSTIGGSASGGRVDKKPYQTKKLLLIR